MAKDWKFSPDQAKKSGKPVTTEDLATYKLNFEKAQEKKGLSECFDTPSGIRKGEFFGRDRIIELLAAADKAASTKGKECVGIRLYYGLAFEEIDEEKATSKISTKLIKDETMRPRLFLVGVDQDGDDIEIDLSQLKDGGGNGLGDGYPKPPYGNN